MDLWNEFAGRSYLSNLSELQQLMTRWGGSFEYQDGPGTNIAVTVVRTCAVFRPTLLHHPRGPFSYHNALETEDSDLDEEQVVRVASITKRPKRVSSDDDDSS